MNYPKVIYLGGAPFIGKTTVACILAARLNYGTISTDDISAAITAVTTAQTHTEFHYMQDDGFPEYYVVSDKMKLISDINQHHKALWPALQILISNHLSWSTPVVIEGWALRPEYIARVSGNIAGIFLLSDDHLIEQRVRFCGFGAGASDKEKMIRQYLERSFWYRAQLKKEVANHGLQALSITPDMHPDDIADECMRILAP